MNKYPMRCQLIRDLIYYPDARARLRKAFKRLRKENYRCKVNISRRDSYVSNDNVLTDLFIYSIKPRKRYWYNQSALNFYFNGNLELIQGIFESEGVFISYVYTGNQFNLETARQKYFNIMQTYNEQ